MILGGFVKSVDEKDGKKHYSGVGNEAEKFHKNKKPPISIDGCSHPSGRDFNDVLLGAKWNGSYDTDHHQTLVTLQVMALLCPDTY